MRAIMSVVLMHVLAVVSATAGICHYCDNAGVTRQYGYAYNDALIDSSLTQVPMSQVENREATARLKNFKK